MHPFFKDMAGLRFGRLRVLTLNPERGKGGKCRWDCVCDCGALKTVYGIHLRRAGVKSCGCYNVDLIRARSTTHGRTGSSIYKLWGCMVDRCANPKTPNFKIYGGRGIRVCERWLKFENFLADMGERPSLTYSIERINNNGNYEPGNCRWATRTEQARNRRNTRLLCFNGQARTLAEWSEVTGLPLSALSARLYMMKWSLARILTTPVNPIYHNHPADK